MLLYYQLHAIGLRESKLVAEVSSIRPQNVQAEQNEPVTLLTTGDIMLGRTVMSVSKKLNDPLYPFGLVSDKLNKAGIVYINLENPIIKDCPQHVEGFRFCADLYMVEGLSFAGVDVVNIANNHMLNWGEDGKQQTLKTLSDKGIKTTGYGNLAYVEQNRIKFGFIGFDFVTNGYILSEEEKEVINRLDANTDILVSGVHWGNEYDDVANSHQRKMAQELIDMGVDLIIGHHPHWVQDLDCFIKNGENYEVINIKREDFGKKYCPNNSIRVYYSLGNFIFDQMWSEETRRGLAVEFTFVGGEIVQEEYFPVYMREWAQPVWEK